MDLDLDQAEQKEIFGGNYNVWRKSVNSKWLVLKFLLISQFSFQLVLKERTFSLLACKGQVKYPLYFNHRCLWSCKIPKNKVGPFFWNTLYVKEAWFLVTVLRFFLSAMVNYRRKQCFSKIIEIVCVSKVVTGKELGLKSGNPILYLVAISETPILFRNQFWDTHYPIPFFFFLLSFQKEPENMPL